MSKFEILQNGKIEKEVKYITDALEYNIYLNSKIVNFSTTGDILMKILIDGSKV
tara:strand:- start:250 stop:411 length:162 start_codon:yes stop_codon:yes gene_type:complete